LTLTDVLAGITDYDNQTGEATLKVQYTLSEGGQDGVVRVYDADFNEIGVADPALTGAGLNGVTGLQTDGSALPQYVVVSANDARANKHKWHWFRPALEQGCVLEYPLILYSQPCHVLYDPNGPNYNPATPGAVSNDPHLSYTLVDHPSAGPWAVTIEIYDVEDASLVKSYTTTAQNPGPQDHTWAGIFGTELPEQGIYAWQVEAVNRFGSSDYRLSKSMSILDHEVTLIDDDNSVGPIVVIHQKDCLADMPAGTVGETLQRRRGRPSSPILSRADETAIQNHAPTGADLRWGLTDVILHELTHGIARIDACHNVTGMCVFDGTIGTHFYAPIRNHFERVRYPDWEGLWIIDSAWAELDDINRMRKDHGLSSVSIVPP